MSVLFFFSFNGSCHEYLCLSRWQDICRNSQPVFWFWLSWVFWKTKPDRILKIGIIFISLHYLSDRLNDSPTPWIRTNPLASRQLREPCSKNIQSFAGSMIPFYGFPLFLRHWLPFLPWEFSGFRLSCSLVPCRLIFVPFIYKISPQFFWMQLIAFDSNFLL